MHDSQAAALWHAAGWLTLSAVFRFGRGRLRQRRAMAGNIDETLLDADSGNTGPRVTPNGAAPGATALNDAAPDNPSNRLMGLADEVLTRQVILRSWLGSNHPMSDTATYWAPVIILFQQTGDLLHELHQQMLETSPLAYAPVIPALDRQVRAFLLNEDAPETGILHFAGNADHLIREMTRLRNGISGITGHDQP